MVVVGLTESIAQINYKNLSKYQLKPGESMIQSTVIFDMEGFSMRHITYKPGKLLKWINNGLARELLVQRLMVTAMDTAIQILQANEANYPESLRKVFVINGIQTIQTYNIQLTEIFLLIRCSTQDLQYRFLYCETIYEWKYA